MRLCGRSREVAELTNAKIPHIVPVIPSAGDTERTPVRKIASSPDIARTSVP